MRTGAPCVFARPKATTNNKGLGMGNMSMPAATGITTVQDDKPGGSSDAISFFVDGGGGESPAVVKKDGTVNWRFNLGQCVSHRDQLMPSLVMGRVKTGNGLEVYGVRSFATVDPCRDRIMLADSLVDVVPGSLPCHDCLLFNTGMCPGDKR